MRSEIRHFTIFSSDELIPLDPIELKWVKRLVMLCDDIYSMGLSFVNGI